MHRDGTVTCLTAQEAGLLAYLAARPREPIDRDELLEEVLEGSRHVFTRAVDLAVGRLRKKLELDPRKPAHILTVRGHGYRWAPPADLLPLPPAPVTPGSNLRPDPDRFVGREAELEALREALSLAHLVTVIGPPGVGKSRLAREFARAHPPPGERVWLAQLSPETRSIRGAIADALGLPRAQLETIVERPALLILDRGESHIEALREALPALTAGALRVLLTSREPTDLPGERCLPLRPLTTVASAALLRDRIAAKTGERPSAEDCAGLAERLEGLPLALELAADRCRLLGLARVTARASQRMKLLGSIGLRAAIESSWRGLLPPEAQTLGQCAVFAAGFNADLAEQVVESEWDTLDALDALCRKSLLHRRGDRLAIYDSVRDFVLEQRPPPEALHRRHAVAVRDYLLEAGRGVHAVTLAEYEDLCLAHEWALSADPKLASQLLALMGRGLDGAVSPSSFTQAAERSLERMGAEDLEARALTRRCLGSVLLLEGRLEEARTHAEVAATLGEAIGRRQEGLGRYGLGMVARTRGRYREAQRHLSCAVRLLEDPFALHRVRSTLAFNDSDLGIEGAREALTRCGQWFAKEGFEDWAALCVTLEALAAAREGRWVEARLGLDEGLAGFRSLDTPRQLGFILSAAAEAELHLGRLARVVTYATGAVEALRSAGVHSAIPRAEGLIAMARLRLGHHESAWTSLRRAERQQLEPTGAQALLILVRAGLEWVTGARAEAAAGLERAGQLTALREDAPLARLTGEMAAAAASEAASLLPTSSRGGAAARGPQDR